MRFSPSNLSQIATGIGVPNRQVRISPPTLNQLATGIWVLNRPSRLRKFSRIWLSHHRGGVGGVYGGPWSGTPSGRNPISRFSRLLSRRHPIGRAEVRVDLTRLSERPEQALIGKKQWMLRDFYVRPDNFQVDLKTRRCPACVK